MLLGRHARSPSKDRPGVHESKTAARSADHVATPPAPEATGSQRPSACRCDRSPATPGRRSELGSWQSLKPTHDPKQGLHIYVAIDNNAPTVRAHNLDSTTARFAALFRLLRNDHRRHESCRKLPFAIRLAPGEQQLVGNPMSARRRRCQPGTRKALLHYPQLFCRRPSTAATRVNNFKATDVASVSNVIHTDNQLQTGQFDKAAYVG